MTSLDRHIFVDGDARLSLLIAKLWDDANELKSRTERELTEQTSPVKLHDLAASWERVYKQSRDMVQALQPYKQEEI